MQGFPKQGSAQWCGDLIADRWRFGLEDEFPEEAACPGVEGRPPEAEPAGSRHIEAELALVRMPELIGREEVLIDGPGAELQVVCDRLELMSANSLWVTILLNASSPKDTAVSSRIGTTLVRPRERRGRWLGLDHRRVLGRGAQDHEEHCEAHHRTPELMCGMYQRVSSAAIRTMRGR